LDNGSPKSPIVININGPTTISEWSWDERAAGKASANGRRELVVEAGKHSGSESVSWSWLWQPSDS